VLVRGAASGLLAEGMNLAALITKQMRHARTCCVQMEPPCLLVRTVLADAYNCKARMTAAKTPPTYARLPL